MELFDEDLVKNEKTDNKKTTTIVTVLIIFLIVMILIVIGAMIYIKQNTLRVYLDGRESSAIKNFIIIDEKNSQNVYVPIMKISSLLGYDYYTGDYVIKSEEANQCYVECEKEVAMFTLSDNVIYKTLKDGNNNYEYFTINSEARNAVISIDGEMYTTIDGIEKAFNVSWDYDIDNKKMDIYTMPYLVSLYSQRIANTGNGTITEDFNNQKALLEGMIITENNTSSGNKVSVLNANNGEKILEAKYDEIEYLEHTKDFLVTSEQKKGIISSNKKTIVKLQYDDIELMDYDKKLYLVEVSGNYGIIDFNGKKVINSDYSEIGIDISNFKENNIKSKYIIAGNLIPVKRDNLWGFFNTNGEMVTDFKYDNIGYVTNNNKAGSGYSLLYVPNYNVIVVGQNQKYSIITSDGKEIDGLPFVFDSIYLSTYGGETRYLFEYNGNEYSVTDQLDRMGYGKTVKKETTENQAEENNTEENNTEEQTVEGQENNTNNEDNSQEGTNQNAIYLENNIQSNEEE